MTRPKKDKATQLKVEMLAMMQTGKTTSSALRSALNSEGWRLSSPDVCSALDVMKRWGWVRVAEMKRLPAGKRTGERPTKIWEARRDVPTTEEVDATRRRRRRKRGSKAKAPTKTRKSTAKGPRAPKFSAYLGDGKLMVRFENFEVPAAAAQAILELLTKS